VDGLNELNIVYGLSSVSMICVQNGLLNCKNGTPEWTKNRYFETKNWKFFWGGDTPSPHPTPKAPRLSRLRRFHLGALGDSSFSEVWLRPCVCWRFTIMSKRIWGCPLKPTSENGGVRWPACGILLHASNVLFVPLSVTLCPPYGIGQAIIFLPCGFFFFLASFLPRLISAVADWMSAILPQMMWP